MMVRIPSNSSRIPEKSRVEGKEEKQRVREIPLYLDYDDDPAQSLPEKALEQYREIVSFRDDLIFREALEGFVNHEGVIELDLNSDQFEEVRTLEEGWSLVYYGRLKVSGIEIVLKPEAYADHQPEFEETKDYDRRALAALVLERYLGINLTPPTEMANIIINGKEYRGTIQQFISGKSYYEIDDLMGWNQANLADLEMMAVADIACFSGDNHQRNIVVSEEKVSSIDRSIAFSKKRGFKSFAVRNIAEDRFHIYRLKDKPRGDLSQFPEVLEKLEELFEKRGIPPELMEEMFTEEEQELIREQARLLLQKRNIQQVFETIKERYRVLNLPDY